VCGFQTTAECAEGIFIIYGFPLMLMATMLVVAVLPNKWFRE
jgi:hypothetical protein